MDNKTGLNPKLSDMYDKIMSTPVKSGISSASPLPTASIHTLTQSPAPPAPFSSTSFAPPVQAASEHVPSFGGIQSSAPAPVPPATPPILTNPIPPTAAELSKPPVAMPGVPNPQQYFSTPQPVKEDKPFTYSVKKNTVEVMEPQGDVSVKKSGHHGVPTPVLIIGVILFFAGYLVFWLKVLEFF